MKHKGFTIVELLIVIVVIGILAAIVIVAFNGIQSRARTALVQSDIRNVNSLILAFHAINGRYPVTSTTPIAGGNTSTVTYTDPGCSVGTPRADWVPELSQTLPKSDNNTNKGVGDRGGCYMYQSDGTSYILSAWNMLSSPQSNSLYRRIGFREMSNAPFYYCNQVNIGGNNPAPYVESRDYYKYSLTVTNISFCNETPPSGA